MGWQEQYANQKQAEQQAKTEANEDALEKQKMVDAIGLELYIEQEANNAITHILFGNWDRDMIDLDKCYIIPSPYPSAITPGNLYRSVVKRANKLLAEVKHEKRLRMVEIPANGKKDGFFTALSGAYIYRIGIRQW